MPSKPKIGIADYYDLTPPLSNTAGDIWSHVPTYGYIAGSRARGLVITPACDLSNRKVESVTYLPLIPVKTYLATPAFLPEVRREIEGQCKAAGADGLVTFPDRYVPPSEADLLAAAEVLGQIGSSKHSGGKEKQAAERALAGVEAVRRLYLHEHGGSGLAPYRKLFGDKSFTALLKSIVTNSHRLDIHFLPSDGQPSAWSGVPEHSVVLFRHAFSAPVDVFERAQDLQLENWPTALSDLTAVVPGVAAFTAARPVKHARLKPRFLSDLLTRYVAMYVRLGSPDFSADTVEEYASQLGAS